ncbi:MAG: phosphotransferase [Candidatus Micrarchaeota archaeon]|nr:phosphotransferase [Candidatus Micrarchaeota archaeon]
MAIAVAHRQSLVVAADAGELRQHVEARGLRPNRVFAKLLRREYLGEGIRGRLVTSCEYDYSGSIISRQFERLQELHSADPLNVVEPFFAVLDRERRCVGYVMEHVDGKALVEYLFGNRFAEAREHLLAVREIVRNLNSMDLAHGDINWGNVMITTHERQVLIDPEGMRTATARDDSGNLSDMMRTLAARMERFGINVA